MWFVCVCVVSLYGVCVCVFVWSLSGGGNLCVWGGLYINVPYNLVKSLKCYTLNCLKDVIF